MGAKQGIYAYNMGYGTDSKSENTSGNPYYCVCYNYDPELCDTAYFCIDAITGKLLFRDIWAIDSPKVLNAPKQQISKERENL